MPPDEEINAISAVARFLGVSAQSEWIDRRPWEGNFKAERDVWRVRLKTPLGSASLQYSLGIGHAGREPDALETLESLVLDMSYGDQDFEEFFSDMHGRLEEADPETVSAAKKTWRACQRGSKIVRRLLGPLLEPAMDSDPEDPAALFAAALALCESKPSLARPKPAQGKWGLMALAAFCSDPDSIAQAALLGRSVSEEAGLDLPSLCSARESFSSKGPEESEREALARAAIIALSEREALLAAPAPRSRRAPPKSGL